LTIKSALNTKCLEARRTTTTLLLVYYKMPVKYSIVKEQENFQPYGYQLSANISQRRCVAELRPNS